MVKGREGERVRLYVRGTVLGYKRSNTGAAASSVSSPWGIGLGFSCIPATYKRSSPVRPSAAKQRSSSVLFATRPSRTLPPSRILSEDILFCVDVDAESTVELKTTGANGRPLTRLDSIKQEILLFAHSKLSINPDHRFDFATLAKSASWLRKEFSSDLESVNAALRGLSVTAPSGQPDLSLLFRMAAHET